MSSTRTSKVAVLGILGAIAVVCVATRAGSVATAIGTAMFVAICTGVLMQWRLRRAASGGARRFPIRVLTLAVAGICGYVCYRHQMAVDVLLVVDQDDSRSTILKVGPALLVCDATPRSDGRLPATRSAGFWFHRRISHSFDWARSHVGVRYLRVGTVEIAIGADRFRYSQFSGLYHNDRRILALSPLTPRSQLNDADVIHVSLLPLP